MLHYGMTVVLWICSGPQSLSGARGSAQGFQAVFQRPNPGTDTERAEQPLISSSLAHKYLFETASKGRDLLTDLQLKSCILYLLTMCGVVLSRYQNICIQYRYQWKSTVFGTKAKDKTMLIKKHSIFIIKSNKNKMYKNQCHSLCLFKIVFFHT